MLAGLPAGARHWCEITDRYLAGTTLRIRRLEGADGVVHKLTQKIRPVPDDPGLVMLTTMYLPEDEVSALAALPGYEVRKTRWRLEADGRPVAVDQFRDRLDGLVLAETELAVHEEWLPLPAFAIRDVTDDDRFSGGSLATADEAEVRALLDEVDATHA